MSKSDFYDAWPHGGAVHTQDYPIHIGPQLNLSGRVTEICWVVFEAGASPEQRWLDSCVWHS